MHPFALSYFLYASKTGQPKASPPPGVHRDYEHPATAFGGDVCSILVL